MQAGKKRAGRCENCANPTSEKCVLCDMNICDECGEVPPLASVSINTKEGDLLCKEHQQDAFDSYARSVVLNAKYFPAFRAALDREMSRREDIDRPICIECGALKAKPIVEELNMSKIFCDKECQKAYYKK